ncbi:hypothetical protein CJF42_07775 [Pseudoalteromonas sp. NBT06-2]|uniref:TonB-dependent receptor plug domain-containing protein n=1 Tax=Pseudoalteromonas sp. NBT06-2 TaxID=2025950 RepID=UPI000BA757CE|nr:TonB-dependent receptor [Pseudoalteromonas sp. NBT06-2]PAJ74964.1 hypothetical protein CJF42_07775 [Pseudoalteromonas sp. NBT06-2]
MNNHLIFNKTQLAGAIKKSFMFAALSSIYAAAPSYAAEIEADEQVERIIVTGSRIQRSSAQMTTPTTVIDSAAIEMSGAKNIGDLLNKYPALLDGIGGAGNNTNSGDSFSLNNAGLELANLRGLGTNRTLVLVNGRRHVPGAAGTSAVDMSMIPSALVDHIEIITGGASAIYGADAVTGVVNFILKDDIEGLKVDISAGMTNESDGESQDASFTYGTNFDNNKGNITAHLSYSNEEEIPFTARDYALNRYAFRVNPLNTGPDDGIADTIFFNDVRFQALSKEGLFYVPNNNWVGGDGSDIINNNLPPTFANDPFGLGYDTYAIDRETGQFRDFVPGINCQVVPCDGGDGFRTQETGTLNSPSERVIFNINGRYDVNNELRLFTEAKYGKVESAVSTQASVFHDDNFGPLISITKDNPFRPQQLVDIMQQRELDVVALAVIGLNARNENIRETTQFTFGAEGTFSEYDYNFYVQHGKVESELNSVDVLNENYYHALDAVTDANGNAVCRDAAQNPDCVAYNPINGLASDAAKDYVGVTLQQNESIEQTVAAFSLSGELLEAPAGTVDFAVGVEYRKETSNSDPDPLSQAVDADGVGSGLVGSRTGPTRPENSYLSPVTGSYNVKEIYAELLVPLIESQPAIEILDLELAARYSNHSVTGGDSTYKMALNWAINSDFRTRYTYSHAVRAPNIEELFSAESIGGARMDDPCHRDNQLLGPQGSNRIANCASLGLAPDFVSNASFGTRSIASKGNIELNPEIADTLTVGLVYTPFNELSIAVDYWDINIEDAITTFEATDILNNCVDGQSLNSVFCDAVKRDNEGQILLVSTQSINAANFAANGTDLDINYHHDLSLGQLNFTFKGTYLDEKTFQQNAADPTDIDSQAGEVGSPHFRALITSALTTDNMVTSWTVNYIGESTFNKEANPEEYPDTFNNKVKAYTYHNLNLSYSYNDSISLYLGIDNVANKKPAALPNLNAGGLLYDGIGRKYYAGMQFDL